MDTKLRKELRSLAQKLPKKQAMPGPLGLKWKPQEAKRGIKKSSSPGKNLLSSKASQLGLLLLLFLMGRPMQVPVRGKYDSHKTAWVDS